MFTMFSVGTSGCVAANSGVFRNDTIRPPLVAEPLWSDLLQKFRLPASGARSNNFW